MIPQYEVPQGNSPAMESLRRIDAMFIMNGVHPISGHALITYAPPRTNAMPAQPPGGRLF